MSATLTDVGLALVGPQSSQLMEADLPPVVPFPARTPEPGLYAGVPALEYHQWYGASQSRLKIIRDKSPAHAKYAMDHPAKQTPALKLGAAIHTCVLEPDLFTQFYATAGQCEAITEKGKGKRCSKGGSVRRDGHWFCLTSGHDPLPGQPGDPVFALDADEYETCIGVRDSIAAHPNTRHLLEGEAERSAIWRDADTGVLCRGRFDDIARSIGALTDLKSTTDASELRFTRAIYDYGYHIQAAHYLRGARELGIDADTFSIVAAEKEPPYAVAVYELMPAAIFDGGRELDRLLSVWAKCEESGIWPGYSTEVVKIDLPKYAPKQIDERLGEA